MVPPGVDTTLRLTLREGSVYYFSDRSLTSLEPHYFVVVNSKPLSQEVLLLGVCTSKISEAKHRRRDMPETLVEISPQAFDVLKKMSIVDCNDLKQVSLSDFNARFTAKKIKYFDKDLPANLRTALRKAIHASKLLPDEIKALVAKP